MTFFSLKIIFILCILLPFYNFGTPPSASSLSTSPIEFKLKNGMTICLKPTDYEEKSVVFQLFAMGGYAALAPIDRPSGLLAADIAWESGLDDQTSDHLQFELYQNSIEMEIKIQPFDRQIEASCYRDDLQKCLKIVNLLFRQPAFDQEALKRVIANMQHHIRTQHHQCELGIREALLKAHTQDWNLFNPLTLSDLDYVNLFKAEKFFKQCFNNPSEFILVLVGDFDPDLVRPLLEKHLGSIPSQTSKGPTIPPLPSFPAGITKKDLYGFHHYKETLTHLTFPIPTKISSHILGSLDTLCQIIKNRLIKEIPPCKLNKKIEVNYEFPFFPQLEDAWLTIQFSAHADSDISFLTHLILRSLEELKAQGPTLEELKELEHYQETDGLAIEENTYVLSLISNYYRAQWDIKYFDKKSSPKLEKEVIKNDLNCYLKLDQYSVISLHP